MTTNKCKWCKTQITVKLKIYCNSSCKEKYRHKHLTPEQIEKKRERDQKYRDNLSKKMREKRKAKDKIYAKKRWKSTLEDPIKLEARRAYDRKWQYDNYWENKK